MSELPDGLNLGGYRVVGRLGHGAMADVYDAVDSTGHEVALKVFQSGGSMSYTMLERFRREAEATKILRRHPYILTVYASGHEDHFHYIAMEKIKDSRGLNSYLHQKPPTEEILKIGLKIAEAIQYAHDHQIIHRDIKPTNILLNERNEPLLMDFGVAELTDWPSLTSSGALTGTPMYMAPEQARSEAATPASDVYSLGVVLYEGFTGQLPYHLEETDSTTSILDAVKHQPPIPPRQVDRSISKDLNFVLLKALRKDPEERYSTARAFAADLQAVLDGKPVQGRWISPWSRTHLWLRRHRTGVIGGITLMLLGSSGFLLIRDELREYRYRELLLKAREVSREYQIDWLTSNRGDTEMRSARRAMRRGRWVQARDMLQAATDVNERLEQTNPLARTRLELARVEIMLHNSLRAEELFRLIWSNPEHPDPLREVAGFEAALLYRLDGREEEIGSILEVIGDENPGPFRILTEWLYSRNEPPGLAPLRQSSQSRLQRYTRLAEAVLTTLGGDPVTGAGILEALKEEGKTDPYEWPLPYANYLEGRL
jgi:serine/threonine protein kinase